ncbi:hypothetical protein [Paraglaciecola sp.]|uniref:hypothetical protein n=1 Tax=Paraglaciecola sp. TaxID=1920173 RepID=UPI00273E2EB8|nr:hypothetical protein [Paraglaciecola sp.]MDP5031581.1 hypothetical protein [Paraglaciecola sp.]
MLLNFTLQICNNGDWHDAARITIDEQSNQIAHTHAYLMDYAIEHLNQTVSTASSVRLPVELANIFRRKPCFSYLDDILPAGASYRLWIKHLGIADLLIYQQLGAASGGARGGNT